MPATTLEQQRSLEKNGKFPFADTASLQANSGWVLPACLIRDLLLYPLGGSDQQYLQQLQLVRGLVKLVFADAAGNTTCSGQLATGASQINLVDAVNRPAGVVVLDSGMLLNGSIPAGVHEFTLTATALVPRCVVPQPQQRVWGLELPDGNVVSGEVYLVGMGGVVLKRDLTKPVIAIHIAGDPNFRRRMCEDVQEVNPLSPPLRELQLVMAEEDDLTMTLKPNPAEFGNVNITAGSNERLDNLIRLEPEDNGIRIKLIGTSAIKA